MATSYLLVAEPFGKSLTLCCEECGAMSFSISWHRDTKKEWDKVVATCCECIHHTTLALPVDLLGEEKKE